MPLSRRNFLSHTTAAIAITAFDPIKREWVTAKNAYAAQLCHSNISVPNLDGELSIDPATLAEAADDFGHIVSHTPLAVLKPATEKDIQRVIRFCKHHRVKVAMRGQGHAVLGESQVNCGVVIDSRTLNTIYSISPAGAVVDAGVTWRELTIAALSEGFTPTVLADYLDLSIGGVLSVGGIGGNMNQFGSVADNVSELSVVTGRGKQFTCSPWQHRQLFESVLAGLGQFGVVTKATIPLIPAQQMARIYELNYTDLKIYLDDQRVLVKDARFDYQEGQIVPAAGGGWAYKIEVGVYYTTPSTPDDNMLLSGLTPDAGMTTTDYPYFVWLDRVSFAESALRELGLWDTPNPWSDLFIPDFNVESYIANDVIPYLTPESVGAGLVLLYPFRRRLNRRPFFRLPRGSICWAFDILRFPFDPTATAALLDENRRLFDAAIASSGKQYPIGALELSETDWINHYGRKYREFSKRKQYYDPRNIMTPGQGIFHEYYK